MRLEGKVAIVTGAGSGIGQATARRFSREGCRLVVNDLDAAALAQTVEELGGAGHRSVAADVADEQTAIELATQAREAFGRLDIVVNNAGLFHRRDVTDLSVDEFDRLMAVNVRSMFMVTKHAVPLMLDGGGGAIVNLSSVSAYIGQEMDDETSAAYNATKAAVRQLTTSLATRYAAEGIRANSVAPGPIRTNIMRTFYGELSDDDDHAWWHDVANQVAPMQRYGSPDEVANAILFLASDEASFITGATLPVDGGYLAR